MNNTTVCIYIKFEINAKLVTSDCEDANDDNFAFKFAGNATFDLIRLFCETIICQL